MLKGSEEPEGVPLMSSAEPFDKRVGSSERLASLPSPPEVVLPSPKHLHHQGAKSVTPCEIPPVEDNEHRDHCQGEDPRRDRDAPAFVFTSSILRGGRIAVKTPFCCRMDIAPGHMGRLPSPPFTRNRPSSISHRGRLRFFEARRDCSRSRTRRVGWMVRWTS